MYTVLARKWRPQVFEDLVGQQTVTQTLKNAIAAKRIAHAFLFSGPRGVGKTTCARILAKALNCQSFPEPTTVPCNVCPSCADIAASRSMDVLEIDGASNRGIDEVRTLRESAKYQAMRDRYRIFIIDEVHMLTVEAFNALLKILEEPPAHVFFIFATTEFRKVPATIISRCQLFDFKKIPERILVDRLAHITEQENITISQKSLQMIANASEGGLRDALGTLDQVIAFSGTSVQDKDVETVLGLVDSEMLIGLGSAIVRGDSTEVLRIMERIAEFGLDYKIFYNELLAFYRDLFLLRFLPDSQTLPPVEERMRTLANEYDEIQLLRICQQLVSIQHFLKLSGNLRFLFEMTLVKLSQLKKLVPLDEFAESLKKKGDLSYTPVSRSVTPPAYKKAESPPEVVSTMPPTSMDFFALLISDLEVQNSRLAAVLGNAKAQRTDSKIVFYVPESYFKILKMEEKDMQDLTAIVRQKLGTSLQVEIKKGDPPVEMDAVRVATPETVVQEDPIIREFLKAFNGKISKIELHKERYS